MVHQLTACRERYENKQLECALNQCEIMAPRELLFSLRFFSTPLLLASFVYIAHSVKVTAAVVK